MSLVSRGLHEVPSLPKASVCLRQLGSGPTALEFAPNVSVAAMSLESGVWSLELCLWRGGGWSSLEATPVCFVKLWRSVIYCIQ